MKSNIMAKSIKPQTRAAYLAERKRVDDFFAAKQAEYSAATMKKPQPQAPNPYGQGLMNLFDILTGRSQLQNFPWSKK